MTPFACWILVFATVLGLAACADGKSINGYDSDSPSADHTDWCGQSPPSGYCGRTGD